MAKDFKEVFSGLGLVVLLLSTYINMAWSKESRDMLKDKQSLVEVRAVFINCLPDERRDNTDNEMLRFERQEFFKHNSLHSCNKKLALTVKMASEPASDVMTMNNDNPAVPPSPDDEYIPIDHVFEGLDKKRVRLLNPYILRLRRKVPQQAYKLHRIDTVTGVLTSITEPFAHYLKVKQKKNPGKRGVSKSDELPIKLNDGGSITPDHGDPDQRSHLRSELFPHTPNGSSENYLKISSSRKKRDLHIVDRNPFIDLQYARSSDGRNFPSTQDLERDRYDIEEFDELSNELSPVKVTPVMRLNKQMSEIVSSTAWTESPEADFIETERRRTKGVSESGVFVQNNEIFGENHKKRSIPRSFAMYEIGSPDLWYNIKLQLFEKISTPDGKTVWSDLNNGEEASINSTNHEWKNNDMIVRYKPSEWIPRDDFFLPATKLYLLVPLLEPSKENNYSADDDYSSGDNTHNMDLEYIVVPVEDVIYLSRKLLVKKQQGNETDDDDRMTNQFGFNEEAHSRVEVRVSRAITGGIKNNFEITSIGTEQFLTLPHQRPHRAQIDLEVKADENQLVRIGSSGRLATIVSDSGRRTRSTIHVQATNTGLASAKFKVIARDCGPELDTLLSEKGTDQISAGPILLAPQHTQRVRLEVPMELPVDNTKCNVALLNDQEESVAVREVTIKKGDRCFCVWHCDCVCLGEDPRLICREMAQPQQLAAGLPPSERPRIARGCVQYVDKSFFDFCGNVLGILLVLLMSGLLKAVLGLYFPMVGTFGMEFILKPPKMCKYYEKNLSHIPIVYDAKGWPVHPETGMKSVRVTECKVQFFLNVVYFIAVAAIILNCWVKKVIQRCLNCASKAKGRAAGTKVYSARDLKGESMELIRRHKTQKHELRRHWLSPQAERLADNLLHDNTDVPCSCDRDVYNSHAPCDDTCVMNQESKPLLSYTKAACRFNGVAVADSEQEDTDYVLMQMQKSRESLTRSLQKYDDAEKAQKNSEHPN